MPEWPRRFGYSIAATSEMTGVSIHVLMVWERRYGFPLPHRSAFGYRRYSSEQVDAIRRIANLAQSGKPIGELIADYQVGKLEFE